MINEEQEYGESARLGSWDIHDALRSSWTERELNPPDEYSNWLIPVNLTPSFNFRRIIEYVGRSYGLNDGEMVRRLLRYGAQVIGEETEGAGLMEYRDVGTKAAGYVRGQSFGFEHFNRSEKIPVNWGDTSGSRKQSYRIVWWEDEIIKSASKHYCITKADAIRWAVFEAGRKLGEEEMIPEPLYQDIIGILDELEAYLTKRTTRMKGTAIYTIFEAFAKGHGSEVHEFGEIHAPELMDEFASKIVKVDVQLRKERWLYEARKNLSE